MHIHDELVLQRIGAGGGHFRRGCFRRSRGKQVAVGLVHRDECRRHAGSGLEEAAAADAMFPCQFIAHGKQARFEFALLGILRGGEILIT